MATVDLQGRESHRPSQLSGGQQQRVALARILVIQPRVLLLDEPLSNLDAKLRIEMRLELLKLQRDLGLTTIYVTHDQEEALAMSTKIAVINHGQVVQVGPPRAIYEQPIDNFVAAFVGQANLLPGTIRSRSDHRCAVDIADGNIILSHAVAATFQAGDDVWLSLRPEAVELWPCGAENLSNALEGKIITAAYQGAVVEYEVSAAGTILKVRVANSQGQTLYQRGDEVCLSFAPETVICLAGFSNK